MALYKSLVNKAPIAPELKTKQKDYLLSGTLPIIDQGQDLIGGYSNNANKQLKCELPVIIFGDHTRAVKYIDFPFGAGADGIKVLEPKEGISPKFLYYATKYLVMRLEDRGYARHYQYLEKMKIDIPAIPEQKRLVARIEELFSQLDSGMETLKTVKRQLEVYRQAVSKDVFDRIVTESKHYSIKDVCKDIKVGIVIKPAQYYTDDSHGIRAFRSANVREYRINDTDWVYLTQEGHAANKRSELETGDVLIVRSGYPGTACVVTEEFSGSNAIDILIAKPDSDKILPEYLCAFTNSPYGRKLVNEKKRGVAQAHLNVGGYSRMDIIVPEKTNQRDAVNELSARLSVCDSIEKTIDTALQQVEAMRQSILKQTFEGRFI